MKNQRKLSSEAKQAEVISRAEYREILLARMAGGDLYAAETLRKVRAIDKALDVLRVKPIYK